MKYPTRSLWLLAAIAILWGVNWPMMKMALREMGVWQFRGLCVLAGAFWLGGYCLLKNVSFHIPRKHHNRLFICAMCNVLGWNILAAYGLAQLPSGRAALIAYSMPLWVVMLSRFVLRERIWASRWIAIAVGMGGIVLLLWDELEVLQRAPYGTLMMLAAGFVWALGVVFTKGFPRLLPTQSLVFWQMVIGGVPTLIGAFFIAGDWLPRNASAYFGLIFNLTIVFGFCHFAWNELVRTLPANITGITSLSVPVIGVLSGLLLLGEVPRTYDWIALAMLCAAVALVVFYEPAPLRAKARVPGAKTIIPMSDDEDERIRDKVMRAVEDGSRPHTIVRPTKHR